MVETFSKANAEIINNESIKTDSIIAKILKNKYIYYILSLKGGDFYE